jgi:diguanylate cyclase (GGDEF)-like protein
MVKRAGSAGRSASVEVVLRSAVVVALRQILVPNGLLLLAALALPCSGLGFAPRTACLFALAISAMAALLAWRFYVPRALLALLLLALVDTSFLMVPIPASGAGPAINGMSCLLALLLPLNFVVLLLVDPPSFDFEAFGWWTGLVALQAVIVIAVYRFDASLIGNWLSASVSMSVPSLSNLPQLPTLAFLLVGLVFFIHLLVCRTPMDSGLFWSTGAAFLAFNTHEPHWSAAYLAAASLILAVAVVETSYQVAYHDELTGLPGRRAFNRAITALDEEYSIAVVDIDHFKSFNDTFGHDVGDQVLRMVASKLAKVEGHGTAFRCGGEEFAIIFPSGLRESFAPAESLRRTIAATPFVVRGPDRSHRRRQERRQRQSMRSLRAAPQSTAVTVSIGIAEASATLPTPEAVIQAADKALYRAKESGRNRVEIHEAQRSIPVAARVRTMPSDQPEKRL